MTLAEQAGASGSLAAYIDAAEERGRRFGLAPSLTDDRARLMILHGGLPHFPGWFPRSMGGAAGFWIDWRDRDGETRATGGALLYETGPADLAEFVNAGGMDAEGHVIRLTGEAERVTSRMRGAVVFSGNLWVPRLADRKTDLSRWLTESTPLLNKALALSIWTDPAAFVTFVRDVQLDHLQPSYRLPVIVPGVTWAKPFKSAEALHLGAQSPAELRHAIDGAMMAARDAA